MPVLPAWVLKLLPYVLALSAVLGAMWYLDHAGYQRAKADQALDHAITAAIVMRVTHDSEQRMSQQLAGIAGDLSSKVASIDEADRTIIQPTIIKEIRNDPRLSDPALGISDGLRDALNCARRLSGPNPCAIGYSVTVDLSKPAPAVGQDDSGSGDGGSGSGG
ncbi:hypothetical protein D3Y57_07110 [Sphingomonas paeninsulae]|uniref:Uncharacterized protein n=1 Tax=Sphingomonas paeninsulae TaxID=2319844 RepID=A0A494T8W0_SPHPE|nr:hypothetical protein [Sphingomonas paeninsulae]AYJ85787.1 hypothetical protein D3Y57_07110 [Sphingomonas paeninsulae]